MAKGTATAGVSDKFSVATVTDLSSNPNEFGHFYMVSKGERRGKNEVEVYNDGQRHRGKDPEISNFPLMSNRYTNPAIIVVMSHKGVGSNLACVEPTCD